MPNLNKQPTPPNPDSPAKLSLDQKKQLEALDQRLTNGEITRAEAIGLVHAICFPPENSGTALKTQEAQKLFGENFYGPENLKLWRYTEAKLQIPPINAPKWLLEKAQKMGATLTLKPATAPDGSALTMQKQDELMEEAYKQAGGGALLFDKTADWKTKSDFYSKDNPNLNDQKLAWHLDFPPIPDSNNKNYLEQAELQVQFLEQLFAGQTMSAKYRQAIADFHKNKPAMEEVKSKDEKIWKPAAQTLANLTLTKLTRPKPAAVLFDIISQRIRTKQNHPFFHDKYIWTESCSAFGDLVRVGDADADGVSSVRWRPGASCGNLFAPFSLQL